MTQLQVPEKTPPQKIRKRNKTGMTIYNALKFKYISS